MSSKKTPKTTKTTEVEKPCCMKPGLVMHCEAKTLESAPHTKIAAAFPPFNQTLAKDKKRKREEEEKKQVKKRKQEKPKRESEFEGSEPASSPKPDSDSPEGKESEEEVSDPRVTEAVAYLVLWKGDKKNWKFKKMIQTWLIDNMYDTAKLDDATFDILVNYLKGGKGQHLNRIFEAANNNIQEFRDEKPTDKESKTKYKRSRKLKKALHHAIHN